MLRVSEENSQINNVNWKLLFRISSQALHNLEQGKIILRNFTPTQTFERIQIQIVNSHIT